MRCSKCNSPLISGEPFCKICGTKVEEKTNKDLEVIDFDLEEIDNISIENVEEENTNLEPVSLDEIKKTNVLNEDVQEIEIDLEDDEKPEMSQTLIDIMMKPIDLEDTIRLENKDAYEEIKSLKKEEVKEEASQEEVVEEVKEENTELIEEPKEEEIIPVEEPKKAKKEIKSKEHDAVTRTVKSFKPNSKDGAGLTIGVLAIILIVSIILNVCLFVSSDSEKTVGDDNITTIIKTNKVVFDNYEMSVNNGWVVNSDDKVLSLSDNSNEWLSKTFIVDDANYANFVENADSFMATMKNNKYQFTSNYEKKVDGSKLYLFKGKFENATTYFIISAVGKKAVSVTELKFENEVNDKTLDKVMSAIISITKSNNSYEQLDTDSLSEIVKENSIIEETDDTNDSNKTKNETVDEK